MAENDPTAGELNRRLEKLEIRHENLPEKYVLRREYDADQRNTGGKLTQNALDIQKVDSELEIVKKEQAIAEKARLDTAAARRWQLFLVFAGPVVSVLVAIYVNAQGGQTP